jgi:hypothetical protein
LHAKKEKSYDAFTRKARKFFPAFTHIYKETRNNYIFAPSTSNLARRRLFLQISTSQGANCNVIYKMSATHRENNNVIYNMQVPQGTFDYVIYNMQTFQGACDYVIYNMQVSQGAFDYVIYNMQTFQGACDYVIYNMQTFQGACDYVIYNMHASQRTNGYASTKNCCYCTLVLSKKLQIQINISSNKYKRYAMRQIKFIRFNYMRKEAHYQFLEMFNRLLDSYPEIKEIVDVYYPDFNTLFSKEKILMNTQKSSDYTLQIVAADHRANQLLVGIRSAMIAAVHHFDPVIAKAAISLQNQLKPIANIARKPYEEEVSAIKILLVVFQGEAAREADVIGLTPWIRELKTAVTDFERLLQLRNAEQAAKPLGRLRNIRLEIDVVYRKMIDRINAFNTVDEKETYTEFIRQLNAQIEYFNGHNDKQTVKDIKMAIVKSIPAQKYTGKPITLTPKVSFEGTELIFAKDFTLSYNNNITAGNAEITIHGKGAYKGNKTITFFINE